MFVIQSAGFDMKMIAGRTGLHNIKTYRVIDLLKMTTLFMIPVLNKLKETNDPVYQKASKVLKRTKNGSFSTSLTSMINLFDYTEDNLHDSRADCRASRVVIFGELDILKNYTHLDIMVDHDKKIRWFKKMKR